MDIQQLVAELKDARTALAAAIAQKADKSAIDDLKTQIATLESEKKSMQTQLDALDIASQGRVGVGGIAEDTLLKQINESAGFHEMKEVGRGKIALKVNSSDLQTKTAVTTSAVGIGTAGVLQPSEVGGIVPLAQRRLFLRDLLFRGSRINSASVYFVQENAFTNATSPQAGDNALKAESADTFTTTQKNVTTLAHWLPVSRQVMDDSPALLDFIRRKLLYGLRFREEVQLLFGSGSANDLLGLATAASAFNVSLNGTAWNKADILRRAIEQVELADETAVGFLVLNPTDWASIQLLKDGQGRYLIGSPQESGIPQLWGRPVVSTTAMTSGSFLAGSAESAEIHDRLEATIEISLDYSDYRARNMAMVLVEERLVQTIYRPGAFVWGSLNSSP